MVRRWVHKSNNIDNIDNITEVNIVLRIISLLITIRFSRLFS